MSIHACEENAMSLTSRVTHVALALVLSCLATTAAGIQRTFVASSGVDTNPCNLPAPCRTFGAAMAHTDPSGEVIVLDSAGYGAFTVAQTVSIIAPAGVYAGITVFSGTGITIAAGAGVVTLRGSRSTISAATSASTMSRGRGSTSTA